MRRFVAFLLVMVPLVGCNTGINVKVTKDDKPVEASAAGSPAPTAQGTGMPASGAPASGSPGVSPAAGAAMGGMAPVTGAQDVQGAGMGGLGTAAKDMARRAAGSAQSSAAQGLGGE